MTIITVRSMMVLGVLPPEAVKARYNSLNIDGTNELSLF